MAKKLPEPRDYKPLSPELRPRYRTRSDFRLMSRAYRSGWVRGVPAERQADWLEDIRCSIVEDEGFTPRVQAAIRALVSAGEFESRLFGEEVRKAFPLGS